MSFTSAVRSHRISARLAAGLGITALAVGMTGCSSVEEFQRSIADAWAVTYEVSVAGDSGELSEVTYLDSEERGGESAEVAAGDAPAQADAEAEGDFIYSVESMITAQKDAGISATPAEDSVATCRVLLDGVKEIASQTGAPGERVDCTVTTPAFDKK